eukprot:GEZU01010763.1.p1 GENE.GEZU01010763.1~~GEZU01010763.1.p1  ORF type:complete len:560 (+),score=177.48 GEZU01010763.1:26-1681(+)
MHHRLWSIPSTFSRTLAVASKRIARNNFQSVNAIRSLPIFPVPNGHAFATTTTVAAPASSFHHGVNTMKYAVPSSSHRTIDSAILFSYFMRSYTTTTTTSETEQQHGEEHDDNMMTKARMQIIGRQRRGRRPAAAAAPAKDVAREFFEEGRFDEAEAILNQQLERIRQAEEAGEEEDPTLPPEDEIYNNLGLLYDAQGKQKQALEMFMKAVSVNPYNATVFDNIGVLYDKTKMLDSAKRMYSKALELDPNLVECRFRLGVVYEKQEAYQAAYREYKACIERNPHFLQTYPRIAMLLFDSLEKEEEALSFLDEMIKVTNGKDVMPYNVKGYLLAKHTGEVTYSEKMNRLQQALDAYLKAAEIAPESCEPYLNLCIVYQSLGRAEEAERYLEKALEKEPMNEFALSVLAASKSRASKPDEAIAIYQQLIDMYPTNFQHYASATSLMKRMGRSQEAVQVFDRAIERLSSPVSLGSNDPRAIAAAQKTKSMLEEYRNMFVANMDSDSMLMPPHMLQQQQEEESVTDQELETFMKEADQSLVQYLKDLASKEYEIK